MSNSLPIDTNFDARRGSARPAAIGLTIVILALAGLASPAARTAAQERNGEKEYRVKAALLYKFCQFATWQKPPAGDEARPMIIAVMGGDPFGKSLDELEKEKPIGKRSIKVKRLAASDDMAGIDLVFVASTADQSVEKKAIDEARRKSVLLVGESAGFIDRGGMLGFALVEGKLKFEANVASATKAQITISANMLKVAMRTIKEEK